MKSNTPVSLDLESFSMSALHHIANRTKTLPPLRVGIG